MKSPFFLVALALACTGSADKARTDSSTPSTGAQSQVDSTPDATTYKDLVRIDEPRSGRIVTSPLTVRGAARGTWYFEGSFPVVLLASNGDTLAVKPATAKGEWMTENFVPFEATLTFTTTADSGSLVFRKDNPSGEPSRDDQVSLPIRFH